MISPVGLAKDDYDIFTELAKKRSCEEKFTEKQSYEEWIQSIYNKFYMKSKSQGINVADLETLKEKNCERMLIDLDEEDYVPFKAFRDDPLKNPLGTPYGKIEIYSAKIAKYTYQDHPGYTIFNKPLLDQKLPLSILWHKPP